MVRQVLGHLQFSAVIGLLLVLSGCGKETTKPAPVPPEDPRATRTGLIAYFAKAHEERDIEAYAECLHEEYQFWCCERDVNSPGWDWAEWFGRTDDIELTGRMFNAPEISDIRVTFVNQTIIAESTAAEDNFHTFVIDDDQHPEPIEVYWADFLVDMHVVEETSEDRIDHWVDGRANIYLIPDSHDDGKWQIWKIEDKGNVHRKAVEPTTWSMVKAMYRNPKP